MGESGGGSLTGPRLHRLQEVQEDFKMTAGGAWRGPRMKVYDYNQEFGGNYYQPMIQYINHKDIYGPFSKKADVYLPHSAEVTSAKYTNMRYNDKSSAKHNLDQFLVDAHKTQIKELNGTTAMARVNLMKNIVTSRRQPHTPLDNVNTPYNPIRLLKGAPPGQEAVQKSTPKWRSLPAASTKTTPPNRARQLQSWTKLLMHWRQKTSPEHSLATTTSSRSPV